MEGNNFNLFTPKIAKFNNNLDHDYWVMEPYCNLLEGEWAKNGLDGVKTKDGVDIFVQAVPKILPGARFDNLFEYIGNGRVQFKSYGEPTGMTDFRGVARATTPLIPRLNAGRSDWAPWLYYSKNNSMGNSVIIGRVINWNRSIRDF